jgi:RNA:NAD 2'-phosphotransferase (TPT1/KptA family)
MHGALDPEKPPVWYTTERGKTMKISIDVNAILKQMSLKEKIRLVKQLEKETWASQLDEVVDRIRTRSSVRRLSAKEIDRLVEDVRKTRYARTTRRS